MKRIDFLGVPGSGKSTVYKHLRKHRASHKTYLFAAEARHMARTKIIGRENRVKGLFINTLLASKTFRKLFGQSVYLTGDQTRAALEQCSHEYKEFLQACADGALQKSSDPAHMLLGYYWLTGKIEEFYFLQNNLNQDTRVVFDESLSQKIFGLTDLFADNNQFIKDYFSTIPQPAAVVALTGEPSLLLGYLEKKARHNIAHRKLSSDEQVRWLEQGCRLIELAKTVYRRRGVKVLDLSAAAKPAENARLVNDFLTDL